MKAILKLSSVAFISAAILSACGGGGTAPHPAEPTPVPTPAPAPASTSVGVSAPGTLFGITGSGIAGGLSVKTLSPDSGIAYYLPIVNSGSTVLKVNSAQASNNTTNVWTVDATNCSSVNAGASCKLAVAFNANRVSDPSQLSSVITVSYADGTTSSIPVSGNVVPAGNLNVNMPSIIAPNSSGDAYGVITVFNGTNDDQLITANTITPTSQQGVTWNFTPDCDGSGGGNLLPLHACSIAYVYHKTPGGTPTSLEPISVSVPIVNNNLSSPSHGQTVTVKPSASVAPPASLTSPLPYLVYSGGSVSVASGTGSFTLQNIGNAVLPKVNFSGLSSLSETDNCTNVGPNGVCTVNLTSPSGSTPPTSITAIPSLGISGNIVISIAGQALTVSPASYSFGTNFSGAVLTTTVTVSNLNSTELTGLTTNLANADFTIDATTSTCSGKTSLGKFSSCNLTVQYTAPTVAATQTATLSVSAATQATQTVNLSGTSKTSSWSNSIASTGRSYTDGGAAILSLAADQSNNIYFGNSMAPNVPGARDVWQLSSSSILSNLTIGKNGYLFSAPTALLATSAPGAFVVGHYNGSIQSCSANSCATPTPSSTTLGVTSMVQLGSNYYVGLSDKTTGIAGQLQVGTVSALTPISLVTGAVGKMATDNTLVYVPIHNINSTGQLFTISGTTLGSTNIAPSALANNEFITVVYFANGTLYAGTSDGNIYYSGLPVTSSSWKSLTTTPLSNKSSISALGLLNGNLYAGLVNLLSPTSGGGVYVAAASGSDSFKPAVGYTDQSSVSSILVNGTTINVGTYNGNLWTVQ